MRTDRLPTYRYDAPGWQRINASLPADMRVHEPWLPREEWVDVAGFTVHLDRHGPEQPRAILVLVHGGGGNGRLFAPLGMLAAQAGFGAIAPDLPGYGLTRVPRKRHVVYEDWQEVVCATIDHEAAASAVPLVLFGGSMGGMLAYDAAANTRLAASLVVTSLLDPRRPDVRRQIVRWSWLGRVGAVADKVRGFADGLPVVLRWVVKMDAIANDPAVAKAISSDPLSGGNWMPVGWVRTFLTAEPMVEPEAFDVCPVVLAHPAEDRWTDLRLSLPFFERLRKVEKRLVVLEGCGHFPIEEPGRTQLAEVILEELQRVAAA
jgi:alpha-beta hydrolase superfamily lysophospholipase